MGNRTPISVIIAIKARIHGEFDNPHLMQMGTLSTDTLADIGSWCARAIREADEWPAERLKTNPASKAGWVDGPRYRRGDRVWAASDIEYYGNFAGEGRVEKVYDDALLVRIGGPIRANVLIPIGDCNALPFDVHSLKEGDEVYWNDPDNGEGSRYFTIRTIEHRGDSEAIDAGGWTGTVRIIDKDGSELECFAGELA